jgi:hypothetical protein
MPSLAVRLSIADRAFRGCAFLHRHWCLRWLCVYPSPLKPSLAVRFSIASYAFAGCASLTSLDLSGLANTLTSIASYAFQGCANLTSIGLSELTNLSSIDS